MTRGDHNPRLDRGRPRPIIRPTVGLVIGRRRSGATGAETARTIDIEGHTVRLEAFVDAAQRLLQELQGDAEGGHADHRENPA